MANAHAKWILMSTNEQRLKPDGGTCRRSTAADLPFAGVPHTALFAFCQGSLAHSHRCNVTAAHAAAHAASVAKRLHRIDSDGALLRSLSSAGMRVGPVGVDLTRVQSTRYPSYPSGILNDAQVTRVLDILTLGGLKLPTSALWRCDWRHAGFSACTPPPLLRAQPELHAMRRTGFAKVDDWGLEMDALRQQVEAALSNRRHVHVDAAHITSDAPLPALEPLLRNASVQQLIRGYFGGPARYDGHKIVRLLPSATFANYNPFQWHHDRCGRRLKLWVYLHDVDEDTHPTRIAAGTHGLVYYSYLSPGGPGGYLSRFGEEWVEGSHDVEAMTAPAGGGFLFDTNAMHAAAQQPRRGRTRTTVVLEFHPHDKVLEIRSHGFTNPCPAGDWRARQRSNTTRGLPGYALYPQEEEPLPIR